jgi:hypothetical protein
MSAKIFHLYLLLCSSVFENDVRVVKKQRLLWFGKNHPQGDANEKISVAAL